MLSTLSLAKGDAVQLRVFFESDVDSTLMVAGAEEVVACADDIEAGNGNPLVTLDNPAQGLYGVWVGRIDPTKPVRGVLTITAAADAAPAMLAPAQQPTARPGMANPASICCEQQGGQVDIRTAADGSQSGFCLFSDGSECDEWAFYRGECKPGQSK